MALSASTPVAPSSATAFPISAGVAALWSSTPSTRELPPAAAIARARPAQRSSSPVLPICWLTQSAFRTPAAASRCPAWKPARSSSWPTCASTPSRLNSALPELIETTGMPALTARRIAGASPGSGIETTSPSGLLATAWSISALIRCRL